MSILTHNAINTMLSLGNGAREKFIVEAYDVKVKAQWLQFTIGDGKNTLTATIILENDLRKVAKPVGEDSPKYFIKIIDFNCIELDRGSIIEIQKFEPVDVSQGQGGLNSTGIKKQQDTANRGIKTEKKPTQRNNPIIFKSENKTQRVPPRAQEMEIEENQGLDFNQLKGYDKISDLFVDMPAWQIVVRVLEKSYRQFNNKSGKLTKIFSMTLVDRTGMKIQGVMFGDSAKEYHELIKTNGVYRMSRGQIREENYNQNRGDKFSRYNISFNRNSIFVPIKDVPMIPRAVDSNIQMAELLGDWNYERQFDIAGVLLNIGDERTFEKDGRSIYKRTLILGDPQIMKAIEVVIWNKDMFIDPRWLNKTVQLKQFKLSNYKDALSISSNFKSDIKRLQNHRFNDYQGKYVEADFENITSGNVTNEVGATSKEMFTKNIRDLENDINFMGVNQTIYTDLEVWLTHASFKGKWSYEACNNPKCKRSTESFSKCIHCGHYNDNTHRKFILPIELSDITGSLWTTAFDEFAHEIFKGIPLETVYQMSQLQLKEQAEKRMYHQYKIRLSTKRESETNTKHSIVGKVSEVNIEKAASSNVDRIKKILYQ